MDPPVTDEVVAFWGSLAHDGSVQAEMDIFAFTMERFRWADVNDEDYLQHVPGGRRLMVNAQGAVEASNVDRTFTLAGQVWGNGRMNTFRIRVWIPDSPRWGNVPLPAQSQVVGVLGEIIRREPGGMYVIELLDISLPGRQQVPGHKSVPSTPSPAKRTRYNTRGNNPVERSAAEETFQESSSEAGPSGSKS
ncbi:hypothetical protein M231_02213 [Tremella mesenterica]|uniref:Uncharacterized protein n=1 Tax=Tremella mesenterica TaxID=5217 RepID=A0A4Q1BRF5_TREME|nr:hypothetical protein M231_02213 [Tremella mesenterica]